MKRIIKVHVYTEEECRFLKEHLQDPLPELTKTFNEIFCKSNPPEVTSDALKKKRQRLSEEVEPITIAPEASERNMKALRKGKQPKFSKEQTSFLLDNLPPSGKKVKRGFYKKLAQNYSQTFNERRSITSLMIKCCRLKKNRDLALSGSTKNRVGSLETYHLYVDGKEVWSDKCEHQPNIKMTKTVQKEEVINLI